MRLIDADALKRKYEEQAAIEHNKHVAPVSWSDAFETVAEDIEMAVIDYGWISVMDRLPEEHADEHPYEFEQYLCATVWFDVRTVGFGTRIGDDKPHFWHGSSIWDDWVTHWMPLPEPPEGVQ